MNRRLGETHMQGSIEAGKDADFVIWDPDAVHTITKDTIYFRHKVSGRLSATLRASSRNCI